MTLTFNPRRAMVMTYAYANNRGQGSVGSGARTDTTDCSTLTALSLSVNTICRKKEENGRRPDAATLSHQQ